MRSIKLFCLPYAGGSASMYRKWESFVDDSIEIIPVELAGRAKRIKDPFYETVADAVQDVVSFLIDRLDDSDYALFGHSMGAMLIYEVALEIEKKNLKKPLHLFFSGRGAPNIKPVKDKNYHLLEGDLFKDKLLELGGTPPQFFEHRELLDLFLPLLKNDFRLASECFVKRELKPFHCNISAFFGKEEDISSEAMIAWKDHSTKMCHLYYLNGDHFFIHESAPAMVKIIMKQLNSDSKQKGRSCINEW
ncbi:thioesterase II family protein [Aquimarina intermedia]|uniref:Surfactin synthase thioesterase subunit n=1 Tax=Aquimarina intermedia TaxID=350814 RepID=A0A5S5C790_9FLAO|nr:thioesterase domain-containing protein [Aquimarina intermedia]TYP74342.1 surfactin synthase thioesterase subunit [Aquimarina intermedia]